MSDDHERKARYAECSENGISGAVKNIGDTVRESEPPVPDFSDLATRQRLSKSAVLGLVRIFERWLVNDADASKLIDVDESTWLCMKAGSWDDTLSQDQITRASAILGIFKGLHIVFSEPLADQWVNLPNSGPLFGGRPALDSMIREGTPGLLRVRRYIDGIGW